MDARTFWRQAVTRRLKLWGGALCLGQGYYRTLNELSHTFLLGPTRTGKTRLLEWLILALNLAPQKLTTIFFDPHGHSADELLGHFALMGMAGHVVWIDPSETKRYLAYNPVAPVPLAQAGLRASAKASALLAAQGLRDLESIDVMPKLKQAYTLLFHALLEAGLTLNEALYLCATSDEPIRRAIIERIESPYVKLFWRGIDELKPYQRDQRLAVLQARLHPFWATPQLQCITGQSARSLDIPSLIESGQTIIVKAQPYRTLSPEDTRLIMAMMIEDLVAAIFRRPPHTGTPVVLIIDEVADGLCGPEVAKTFRGSAKYGLATWIGTQSLAALLEKQPDLTREVLTNAQTKIVFRDLAYEDLEIIGRDFALESLNFNEIKDEIQQTKFWPHETTRVIESSSDSEGTSESELTGTSLGATFAVNEGLWGPDLNDEHYMQHEGTSSARSSGRSSSWSHGTSEVPWYEMIPFKEVSSRTFRDIEEQFTRAMQQLKALPPRHMAVKQRGQPMRTVEAPYWPDLHMPVSWIEEQIERVLGQCGLYGRIEEIRAEQTARLNQLTPSHATAALSGSTGDDDDPGLSWQPREA
jgi:hypothetical protein